MIADFDHIKKEVVRPQFEECTYIHVPQYRSNMSIARISSHLSFGKQCKRIIEIKKPNLIYCQVPPNNVVSYCAEFKKKYPDSKLIIDIIDLWPESMPFGQFKNSVPAQIWMRWRNNAIRVADYVFTECDLYQEKLRSVLTSSTTSTLHLYKDQTKKEQQLVKEIISREKTDNVIRFAYLGSMNSIIDIDGICGVIKEFIDLGRVCELHAIGDGEGRMKFEEAAKNTGCKTMFYGVVFDELEKIRLLAPCDYAFNMMKDTSAVGLTIKSIDYLSFGIPLINSIKGDTWRLVSQERIGWNIQEGPIPEGIDRNLIIKLFSERFSKNAFTERVRYILCKEILE